MKTDPDAAGFHPDRLERITEHLERSYIAPRKIAGCQTVVSRGGEVAYFRSQGVMRLNTGEPMVDDAIFRIYSMTKPITSVALMTLFERGLVGLQDPISRWIPEFADVKVKEKGPDGERRLVDPVRPVQVRDVLSHTGGLSYGNALAGLLGTAPSGEEATMGGLAPAGTTLETLMPRIAAMNLSYQPGTAWMYSLSTDVCARLVECISGLPYDEYLQQTILGPLGMVDTGFFVPEDQVHRMTTCYRRRPDKTLAITDSQERSRYTSKPALLSGGGGLVSTAADYLRFTQMLTNGGELDGVRVLGRKTLDLMTANHLADDKTLASLAIGAFSETAYEGIGFGLGFAMTLDAVASSSPGAGDFYWGGAASTIFWVDPVEDLSVVFMTQLLPSATFNFRGQLKSIVYGAIAD
jgi:CubicO group peptidase (beta-lactamase class C family)